jgi:hypothetical protein
MFDQFVSLETIRRLGFDNKRDARRQFYHRAKVCGNISNQKIFDALKTNFNYVAKLLLDLKVETRSYATAQGAILLSHHSSAEDPRAGSLWLSKSIESAKNLDSELSSSTEKNINPLRKRIWWSILLRDRSLSIGLRRCPQVTQVDLHGFPGLLNEEDIANEMLSSRVYDRDAKRTLLKAFQEQCQLAVQLTATVSLVFTSSLTPRRTSSVERFDKAVATLKRFKESLIHWEAVSKLSKPPVARSDINYPAVGLINTTYMLY